MGHRIVRVSKLIKHLTLTIILHLQRQISRIFHTLRLGDRDQFGTVNTHGYLSLFTEIFWHDQLHLITAHGRRHCECDAGVSTGGLDQSVTRRDIAAFLRSTDHIQRRPVLN